MANRAEIVSKVISGNATEAELHEFNLWLDEAPENRKSYEEQLLVWQFLGKSAKKDQVDTDQAWASFLQKTQEQETRKTAPYLWYKLAAVFVLLLTVGSIFTLLYYKSPNQPNKQKFVRVLPKPEPTLEKPKPVLVHVEPNKSYKWNKHQKRKDSTFNEIVFPDSSVVVLSPNSVLNFLEYESNQPRIASLAGAGFFNLRPMNQDFILETEQITMRVEGTRFNVKTATEEKRYIEISVEEGFMEASEKANPENKVSIYSAQSYIYNIDSHQFSQVNFEAETNSKWKKFVNKLNQTFKRSKKDKKKSKKDE